MQRDIGNISQYLTTANATKNQNQNLGMYLTYSVIQLVLFKSEVINWSYNFMQQFIIFGGIWWYHGYGIYYAIHWVPGPNFFFSCDKNIKDRILKNGNFPEWVSVWNQKSNHKSSNSGLQPCINKSWITLAVWEMKFLDFAHENMIIYLQLDP